TSILAHPTPPSRPARGAPAPPAHPTGTPVTEELVEEILAVAGAAADEVRGQPAPAPPAGFADVLDALDSGALSPADILALPEDDVHTMVAAVLTGDAEPGMATLLAAIERLPTDVGARLVRAYLAAVMEG